MRKISELICQSRKHTDCAEGEELLSGQEYITKTCGLKVNVLAMGDVGGTLVMGLRLLGVAPVAALWLSSLPSPLLPSLLPLSRGPYPSLYIRGSMVT